MVMRVEDVQSGDTKNRGAQGPSWLQPTLHEYMVGKGKGGERGSSGAWAHGAMRLEGTQ